MSDDKVTKFWLSIGLIQHGLWLWTQRAKAYYNEQTRRHFDRYYRIGRHRPVAIGLSQVRWASHLVAELREDRQLRHHQLLPN